MLLLLSLLVCLQSTVQGITCIGDDGRDVDWYALFKKPVKYDNGGFKYFYSSSGTFGQMEEGQHDLKSSSNPFAKTLSPIYTREIGVNYIMYNDILQPHIFKPCQAMGGPGDGHSKGVVMWDSTSLIWIVHSIPNFPPIRSRGYSFPDSARQNAHTGLCISLKISDLNAVFNQLYLICPHIYEEYYFSIAPEYNTGTLAKVLKGEEKTDDPKFSRVELNTKSTQFISYATKRHRGNDLYQHLVAKFEKTSLVVNTWENKAVDKLPSDCTPPYKVWNTDHIQILCEGWMSSQDRSKYAISYTEGETPEQEKVFLVCIGDTDRSLLQLMRGGGTMCLRNRNLWKSIELSYIRCDGEGRFSDEL